MILPLYRALATVGGPLIRLYLKRRMAQGKEDPARFQERLGISDRLRPEGPLVWLHAASVGEAVSILPLIERMSSRPGLHLLVTTGTVTSARLMADRLPDGVTHQFVPVDRPCHARRFLDHWRPDLVLWTESDFWPNLLHAIARRNIPMVLVQGRISLRSFNRWQHFPCLIRTLLSGFDLCLGQTPDDAARLASLGARRVDCLGNLKHAAAPLPADPDILATLRADLGSRPTWLAASTHAGEEALAGRVHRHVATVLPDVLSIIAPRHPERGDEIAAELRGMGLRVTRRSEGRVPTRETDVYLADTMGELGLFYRLAPLVFVGKSLTAAGGQNPFEPARLGAAVLFGPRMGNFADMTRQMLAADAALDVADENALAEMITTLLRDPVQLAERRRKALDWTMAEAGTLEAVMAILTPFLAQAEAAHARS